MKSGRVAALFITIACLNVVVLGKRITIDADIIDALDLDSDIDNSAELFGQAGNISAKALTVGSLALAANTTNFSERLEQEEQATDVSLREWKPPAAKAKTPAIAKALAKWPFEIAKWWNKFFHWKLFGTAEEEARIQWCEAVRKDMQMRYATLAEDIIFTSAGVLAEGVAIRDALFPGEKDFWHWVGAGITTALASQDGIKAFLDEAKNRAASFLKDLYGLIWKTLQRAWSKTGVFTTLVNTIGVVCVVIDICTTGGALSAAATWVSVVVGANVLQGLYSIWRQATTLLNMWQTGQHVPIGWLVMGNCVTIRPPETKVLDTCRV